MFICLLKDGGGGSGNFNGGSVRPSAMSLAERLSLLRALVYSRRMSEFVINVVKQFFHKMKFCKVCPSCRYAKAFVPKEMYAILLFGKDISYFPPYFSHAV